MKTRPPARRAIASTKRGQARVLAEHEDVDGGAVAAQLVDLRRWWPAASPRVVGQWKAGVPVAGQVRGRLAVGDDQHHRLGVGVAAQVAGGEQQRVLQVGALHPLRLGLGQLHRGEPPGAAGRTR